mmetsp:Transcript_2750/g.10785  ORF Transcript_2750/g.10785 Transcript_2750/m.10785 type:complete len:296 (-) Transcript_2750:208-1095(-)
MRGTRRRHLLHKLVVSLHPSRGGRHLRTHLSHSPHRHHRREGVGRRRGSRSGGLLRVVLPRGGRDHRRVLDLPRVGPLGPRRRRRRLREPNRGDGAARERGDRRRRRLLALVHARPRLLRCGHRAVGSKAGGHGHRRGVESRKGGHTRSESHGDTPGDSRGELRGNLGSLGGLGGSLGDDVEEAAPALALVEVVLANEVLLRVRGNLRRGARLHEVAGDASPVALAELLKAEEEEAVLVLGPGNALLALSGRRDRGIRQMAVVLGRRRSLFRVLLNRVGGLRLSHPLGRRLYEFR